MRHQLAGVPDDSPATAGRVDLGDAAVPEGPAGHRRRSSMFTSASHGRSPTEQLSQLRRPWCSCASMVPGAFPSAAATWATL